MLRVNDDILAVLHARQNQADRAASSYWNAMMNNFSVDQDGTLRGWSVLGHSIRPTEPIRILAHRGLQAPFALLGLWRFRHYREIRRLGETVASRTNRMFTYDILRQVLSLALIREHMSLDGEGPGALVIGDGLGVMTSLLALAAPRRKIVVVNLIKSLFLDVTYIRRAAPDATVALAETEADMDRALADPIVRVIAVQADDAGLIRRAPIGLAVNIVSMQEMNPDVVAAYFSILRENPAAETVFYCANRLAKPLPDGTVVRFADYPWRANDTVLVDAVCTWAQWTYSRRPPFWHYRWGDDVVTWHRLARLAKDRTASV
jgi:hypothetical protein